MIESPDVGLPPGLQQRTLRVLVGTQVLAGAATASGVTVGSLLARDLLGADALAGIATASLTLGSAVAAVPLARLAGRSGRRPALVRAFALGALGALVVALSAVTGAWPLLVLGMVALGVGQAGGLQTRFAAADLAPFEARARAIGVVVWATTLGSVAAPNLLGVTSSLASRAGLEELAGLPFAAGLFAAGAAVVCGALLRPDPLVVSGGLDRPGGPRRSIRRSARVVRRHPDARLALITMVMAHMVMVAVMSMTALHLDDGGQSKGFIGFVISVHIAGMYAFSPVAGFVADRLGRVGALAASAAVLMAATYFSGHTDGSESGMMLFSLFVLGVGWSLAVIAGSALLTDSVDIAERVSVQGLGDLSMSGFGAAAGLGAGFVMQAIGYHHLSHVGLALAAGVFALAVHRWITAGRPSPDGPQAAPAVRSGVS
jgi:MFS family permease